MKNHRARLVSKAVAVFLVVILFYGNSVFSLPGYPEQQDESLSGLFQWAISDYQTGKYWEVNRNLELLLSYFDEENGKQDDQDDILKGRIYLLLGASCEQLGDIEKAKGHYQLARDILDSHKVKLTIEGIDFSHLKEYQRIVMGNQGPVVVARVIEKPKTNRKKRISPLVIIGGLLVLGGAAAALLMKKKQEDNNIPDDRNVDFSMTWVHIPTSKFLMGDNFDEGNPDERPVHIVYLDEYYISKFEITFDQYDYFCERTGRAKPSDNGWGRGKRPVINVSYGDAHAFCEWLSSTWGQNIQLPTEAQWENAARGDDQRRYPWGNADPDCNTANYNCYSKTFVVGSYGSGASPYGAYDMAGNVSEWCRDEYDPSFYRYCPYQNPVNYTPTPQGRVSYVIRGGSWDSSEDISIRTSDRYAGDYDWGGNGSSDLKSPTIGFRIVQAIKK